MREPLHVYALDSDMNRSTGVIPYTSLQWCRRYKEPGTFTMSVPSNVYEPEWAFIVCYERPEFGLIQKVEFDDSSHVAGGIDTIIVSGFFAEQLLNNFIFLIEQPTEHTIQMPNPKPRKATYYISKNPTVYQDPMGDYYYTNDAGEIVSADDGRVVTANGLTEVDYYRADGPSYGTDEVTASYTYWSRRDDQGDLGDTIHVVRYEGNDSEYEVKFRDDSGNVFYEDDYGNIHQAVGVVDVAYDSGGVPYYTAQVRAWEQTEDQYKTVYVKGPWQRTDAEDPITEQDSVQLVFRWAQQLFGNSILYEEPEIEGVQKTLDPSQQYLGDVMYSTLWEVEASLRLQYSFESNIFVLSAYRGLDRTQDQEDEVIIVEDPRVPDGFTELEYVEADGSAYIDTGFIPDNETRTVATLSNAGTDTPTWFFGVRSGTNQKAYGFMATNGQYRSDYNGQASYFSSDGVPSKYTVDKNANVTSIDGTVRYTANYEDFSCEYSMYILGMNQPGGHQSPAIAGVRMHSCQVYNGVNKVRDFLPCRRDVDSKVGMYDLVTEEFFDTLGNGNLIAGPEAEVPTHEEIEHGNPWAVFSDTWGSLYDYSASRDTSNYKNVCYVLYDYDKPDSFDENGWPTIAEEHGGELLSQITAVYIPYTSKQGYNTERVGGEDEPDIETMLDLRDEKPSCDNVWSRDRIEIDTTLSSDEQSQAIENAKKQLGPPDDGSDTNLKPIYEAFESGLQGRGKTYLEENYHVEEVLDTGTLNVDGYMTEFDLGDKVDMAVSTLGLKSTARIIGVDEVYESQGNTGVNMKISLTIGDEQVTAIQRAMADAMR